MKRSIYKKFNCDICPGPFAHAGHLKNHMKNKHNRNVPFPVLPPPAKPLPAPPLPINPINAAQEDDEDYAMVSQQEDVTQPQYSDDEWEMITQEYFEEVGEIEENNTNSGG